jgi:hypothetical protein
MPLSGPAYLVRIRHFATLLLDLAWFDHHARNSAANLDVPHGSADPLLCVKGLSVDTEAFALEGTLARSGEQSGDLQGLSNVQGADSESVDELIEEGNTFEAEAVKGVEDAGDADEAEVRTHDVPQDDVSRGVSGQKVAR